ncbi:MAG: ABC-2 transporter permease, partial [Candidatus Faecousia sp.]|nr:ABC-2 transporter permease [Candidatus Faecousia sp.]
SVLLPIAKRDVVTGKYAFVCLIECAALLLMALAVVLRMTVFAHSAVYRANALMNANFFALGTACLNFGLFNWIFVGGFFKTAYRFARPFVTYLIVAFLVILIAEALHHVPGLEALNAFGTDGLGLQLGLLAGGLAGFLLITVLSCKRACARFEAIDL